jgi:hypothetical protein
MIHLNGNEGTCIYRHKVRALLLQQIITYWNCQKILKHVMPKNLKETTIAPGQLWHELYYFYFCRIFPKKKHFWMSEILKIQSREVVRWEPMNQSNKVVKPLISLTKCTAWSKRKKKKVLLNLFLCVENFKIRNSTLQSESSNYNYNNYLTI